MIQCLTKSGTRSHARRDGFADAQAIAWLAPGPLLSLKPGARIFSAAFTLRESDDARIFPLCFQLYNRQLGSAGTANVTVKCKEANHDK